MSEWVEEGQPAPDFELQTDRGESFSLSAHRGQPIVLYFYPKDDTPGCTVEACAFRDRRDEVAKRGAVVVGVSPDGVESHAAFRDKFALNFPLLADPDHAVADAYGAWGEKNMYGKKSMGIRRSTFLIGPDGVVRKAWKKVDVKQHDQQVLDALADLAAPAR